MSGVKLFEPGERIRLDPMHEGESDYSFINDSAWEACASYRELANGWVAGLPVSHQQNAVRDLKKAGSPHRYAALMLELVVSSLLRALKFNIELHPTLSGTTKLPDFRLVGEDDAAIGYVEVTTMGPSDAAVAGGNRSASIYKAIDALRMPAGYVLAYNLVQVGNTNISARRLCRDIANWIKKSSPLEVNKSSKEYFSEKGWVVELTLHNLGTGKIYDGAIQIVGPRAAWVDTIENLKTALRVKDNRYGDFAAPFLIVVGDVKGRSWGSGIASDLSQALFGSEVIQTDFRTPATWSRKPDGFWLGGRGPKNGHVSGVLFFPDCGVWGLRNLLHKPLLAVNPWATHPLPEPFTRLVRMEVDKNEWVLRSGEEVADLIGLPQTWPPPREPMRAES